MPRGDGTGPMGMGPMTGRATGFCAGYPVPGFTNPAGGRGFWGWGRGFRGRGGGRGWRHWYYATGVPGWARASWGVPAWGAPTAWGASYAPQPAGGAALTPEQELDALKGQAEYFEEALESISKRIEELKAAARKQ